ncbi:hypothetical protein SY88_20960 [Clostridiales bacterium PH28_bin88]|nr:hypothetical protein SY88_20960 [Clostridiales bacterium PH28_bin88]
MPGILFVTGKLAARALSRTLAGLELDFPYLVQVLPITVAALMDTGFVARHLQPGDFSRVVLPGYCRGELEIIRSKVGVPVVRGPKDLQDLGQFLGRGDSRNLPYGEYRIKILAEIADAPLLPVGEILVRAARLRESGADIIDIGCIPRTDFPHLRQVVRELKGQGYRVSIDSFNEEEVLTAAAEGADLVLSVHSGNLDLGRRVSCPVVLIPDADKNMDVLWNNIETLGEWGVPFMVDPLLEPLNCGFVASLLRYRLVREKYPEVPMLMGVGNITELTDADSTGVNALLTGMAEELGIEYLLTTEASSNTRGVVKELDAARRLMYYSRENGIPPKRVDTALLTVKDRDVRRYAAGELREMQEMVKDRNYRIFAGEEEVFVFNAHQFVQGRDPEDIFSRLQVKDGRHAFYLGRELFKARLAMQLGKKYIQDEDLGWGYLSPPAGESAG